MDNEPEKSHVVMPNGHLVDWNLYKNEAGDVSFLGDLGPEAFILLEPWKIYGVRGKSEIDVAYRIGIKENIRYPAGDVGMALCHFMIPLSDEGKDITPEQEGDLEIAVKGMVDKNIEHYLSIYGKILSVNVEPPAYMVEDIDRIIVDINNQIDDLHKGPAKTGEQ